MYMRKHQAAASQADPATRFSDSVQIVQFEAETAAADEKPVDRTRVSTPATRRAAIGEIRRAEQQAAGRRRNVVMVLGVVVVVLGVLGLTGVTPWWPVAIPGGLLVAFLAIARFSVQAMHRNFEDRLDRIDRGWDEDTVIVATEATRSGEKGRKRHAAGQGRVESVELGAPVGHPGTLWDPLPITRPTYVSAPTLSGRTVRTIDLTEPITAAPGSTPVVADAPEEPKVFALRRAVGE